jgi:hypothetical protein
MYSPWNSLVSFSILAVIRNMVLFLVATGSAWFTTTSSTQMQSYSGCAMGIHGLGRNVDPLRVVASKQVPHGEVRITILFRNGTLKVGGFGQMEPKLKMYPEFGNPIFLAR